MQEQLKELIYNILKLDTEDFYKTETDEDAEVALCDIFFLLCRIPK